MNLHLSVYLIKLVRINVDASNVDLIKIINDSWVEIILGLAC